MYGVTQADERPNGTALRRRTAEDLRAQALTPGTRKVYRNHIRRWLAWWGGRGGEPTGVDVADFLLWVRDVRGLSVASVVSYAALNPLEIEGGRPPSEPPPWASRRPLPYLRAAWPLTRTTLHGFPASARHSGHSMSSRASSTISGAARPPGSRALWPLA